MQILVDLALGTLFPEQCDEWLALKQCIHETFVLERTEKESAVSRDIANMEAPLQHALREEVVGHVISIFPYVHCQYLDQMQVFTRYSSLDRGDFSSTLGGGTESADLLCGFHLVAHLLLPASTRLADSIRALYPEFQSVFENHVKNARFYDIPSKGPHFKDLKLVVSSLWHLQRKSKHMPPEARSALIQALVVKHDFQGAFQVTQRSSSLFIRCYTWFKPDPRGEESFRIEMKTAAAQVSDSQFLQRLESTNEEDLQSTAQTVKDLAKAALLSSIDGVVKKLTDAVLVMQRGRGERQVQRQVEKEESEVLAIALVCFIREINKKSAGGGFS